MQEAFTTSAIWESMGWTARGVILVLFIMSVYSLGLALERYIRLYKARKQSLVLAERVAPLLDEHRLRDARDETERSDYSKSHLARVIGAGIERFTAAEQADLEELEPVAAATRAMDRQILMTSADFKRGLTGLATISTTAPFVGLFGTVVGIINAFRGMAASGSGGLGAVSAGIAEALVATAFGLFVAIPAVWLYNYFHGRIERFEVEMNNTASEISEVFLEVSAKQGAARSDAVELSNARRVTSEA